MTRDAERLEVPMPYEMERVAGTLRDLARANSRPEGMARVSFVKNQGGLWSQADDLGPTDLLIFTRELVPWPAAQRLVIQPMGIFSGGRYAGAKMLSWAPHAAVLARVHEVGYDDALLLNEMGHLAECTSANIFLVRGGKVLTPPLSSGCLSGITREILFEIAPRAGIEIREQELTAQDLATAEEVFISSTTREVAAISQIDPDWKFPAPGQITTALEHAFQDYVHSYLAANQA